MKQFLLFISFFICLTNCTNNKNADTELYNLTKLLTGTFSSSDQAKTNTGYTNTKLINTPIWSDKPGYWFYSEIHNTNKPNTVYFQRVLQIERLDSLTLKSTNYTIQNAENYINGWQNKAIFNKLTIENLEIREGCDIYYKKKTPSIYVGKTSDHSCLSLSKNITFTVSNLIVTNNKISVWDRGYDIEGKQVWGKIQEPYKYKRISKK